MFQNVGAAAAKRQLTPAAFRTSHAMWLVHELFILNGVYNVMLGLF
jgi:hypothetical protein